MIDGNGLELSLQTACLVCEKPWLPSPTLEEVGVGVNKQVEVEGSKVQVLPGHTGRLKPCLTP